MRLADPVPFAKVTDIETEVKNTMTMGIIEPSKSPFCSPQLQKHGDMMFPIAYASKKLPGAPKSYATVEK